jgi:ribonuclease J
MARIALDEHPNVSLDAGDRVIFSSHTIPGNEKAVGRVQNGLADLGIEVVTETLHACEAKRPMFGAPAIGMGNWIESTIPADPLTLINLHLTHQIGHLTVAGNETAAARFNFTSVSAIVLQPEFHGAARTW